MCVFVYCCVYLHPPIHDERLFDLSMMARLLGLFSRERFANEISAVTRVIVILEQKHSVSLLNSHDTPKHLFEYL